MNEKGLPRFTVIAAALRDTTERLLHEIHAPQEAPPRWDDFQWAVARAVSAMHGASALLATRLRWRGPPAWERFLDEQRRESLARHEIIGEVLAKLELNARAAGLPYVALKGAEIRDHSLHHPGERPMGDIDILVDPSDVALAAEVVCSLGYASVARIRRHEVFSPTDASAPHAYAESAGNPLHIEVHTRIGELLGVRDVDITRHVWPLRRHAGNNRYPSLGALLLHVALHTSGSLCAHSTRFVQINDCALLSRRMGRTDWTQLLGCEPRETPWWMYPALVMAERYVPASVPPDVLSELAAACPPRLRARYVHRELSTVSWSTLHTPVLPGLEWSRGAREGLRLAWRRALPDRVALEELREFLKVVPHFVTRGRLGASRAARIARWIFGRPPRIQTLSAVTAALRAHH